MERKREKEKKRQASKEDADEDDRDHKHKDKDKDRKRHKKDKRRDDDDSDEDREHKKKHRHSSSKRSVKLSSYAVQTSSPPFPCAAFFMYGWALSCATGPLLLLKSGCPFATCYMGILFATCYMGTVCKHANCVLTTSRIYDCAARYTKRLGLAVEMKATTNKP